MKPASCHCFKSFYFCLSLFAGSSQSSMAATTHVSGGGAALQNAVAAAASGDELVVDDSLDYSPVSIGTALNIHAVVGQTPRVVSDPAVNSGQGLGVTSGGVNGSWGGIDVIQNVAGGG